MFTGSGPLVCTLAGCPSGLKGHVKGHPLDGRSIVPDEMELRPYTLEAEGCGKIKIDLERPERVLSAFLRKNGIRYLQLFTEFKKHYVATGKRLYFPYRYENHWNPDGHVLAAKVINQRLVDGKLLPVKLSNSKQRISD
jgi:hypothetical protein